MSHSTSEPRYPGSSNSPYLDSSDLTVTHDHVHDDSTYNLMYGSVYISFYPAIWRLSTVYTVRARDIYAFFFPYIYCSLWTRYKQSILEIVDLCIIKESALTEKSQSTIIVPHILVSEIYNAINERRPWIPSTTKYRRNYRTWSR